jgi:hypothetical protein
LRLHAEDQLDRHRRCSPHRSCAHVGLSPTTSVCISLIADHGGCHPTVHSLCSSSSYSPPKTLFSSLGHLAYSRTHLRKECVGIHLNEEQERGVQHLILGNLSVHRADLQVVAKRLWTRQSSPLSLTWMKSAQRNKPLSADLTVGAEQLRGERHLISGPGKIHGRVRDRCEEARQQVQSHRREQIAQ